MKALSGYAEWFWLMAKNIKPVENRTWSLFRYIKPEELPVRIYLHASKKPASWEEVNFIRSLLTPEQSAEFGSVDWGKLRGRIIGEITITDDVTAYSSPWFFGPHGFTVRDGVLYDKPIPCRGWFGFFVPEFTEVEK